MCAIVLNDESYEQQAIRRFNDWASLFGCLCLVSAAPVFWKHNQHQ
jgi:hypothetical protein